jgi:hypothetical protein
VDLLVEDGEILSQLRPVNCFARTHWKKFNHRLTQMDTDKKPKLIGLKN